MTARSPRRLSPLDRHFARRLAVLAGDDSEELRVAATLVSQAVSQGHICLDLSSVAEPPGLRLPGSVEEWIASLRRSPAVCAPGEEARPLVLDGDGRLYLHRYWQYEASLARDLLERSAAPEDRSAREWLREVIDHLLPPAEGTDGTSVPAPSKSPRADSVRREPVLGQVQLTGASPSTRDLPGPAQGHRGLRRRSASPGHPGRQPASRVEGQSRAAQAGGLQASPGQRLAAEVAAARRLCVVTGGPGTGKTWTAVRILALMAMERRRHGRRLASALAAPTGKAAARLKQGLAQAMATLDLPEGVGADIPEEASTLHRLLGVRPRSSRFRHHAGNPLPHDVLVVDEVSMVDLPLMAKLVDALRPDAHLVLLGDADQLASVEPGSVFGDLCSGPASGSPLADCVVRLRSSHRFGEGSGIPQLAEAVRLGETERALAILDDPGLPGVARADTPRLADLEGDLAPRICEGFRSCLEPGLEPAEVLKRLDRFRVLTALRRGPYGSRALGEVCGRALAGQGLLAPRGRWYPGLPVVLTANDHTLRLFNGDMGVILPDPDAGRELRAFFPDGEGVRKVVPARLPDHEPGWTLTVHRSQGSEFDRVWVVLPPEDSAVLSRELLYTALTRARQEVTILARRDVFALAVSRKAHRRSGLQRALWG